MQNYHKQFKKYQNFKKRKNRSIKKNKSIKKDKTYFDKLYIRIFLSSFLLLFLVLLNNFFNINFINQNLNIIPIMNIFTHAYDINNDLEVDLVTNYEKINYVNGINYIQNSTFNGVASANTGIVTQIKKNNNLYYVTIKSEDDLEYTYGGLESIDVLIYSYVTSNNIIGASPKIKDYYTFTIEIKKDNKCFSVSMINNE